MEPQNDQLNRVGLEQRGAPGLLVGGTANRRRIALASAIASSGWRRPRVAVWTGRQQALNWTDNLGGRINRLEPERGSAQSYVLGQNVMSIGLRERGGLVLALAKQLAFYEPGGELELLMEVEQDQLRNASTTARLTVAAATGPAR